MRMKNQFLARRTFVSLLTLAAFLPALLLRAAEAPIRVACVGDSITYGAGVEQRGKNHYPKILGELLGAKVIAETVAKVLQP